MSLLGHPTPLTVRYEEQLILTQAVSRMTKHAMVVGHMPYMTYNISADEAVRNAARFISEGGADAVKCEGNIHTAKNVAEIVSAGVPVRPEERSVGTACGSTCRSGWSPCH